MTYSKQSSVPKKLKGLSVPTSGLSIRVTKLRELKCTAAVTQFFLACIQLSKINISVTKKRAVVLNRFKICVHELSAGPNSRTQDRSV